MKIQTTDLAAALKGLLKNGTDKKADGDMFAMLMAALTNAVQPQTTITPETSPDTHPHVLADTTPIQTLLANLPQQGGIATPLFTSGISPEILAAAQALLAEANSGEDNGLTPEHQHGSEVRQSSDASAGSNEEPAVHILVESTTRTVPSMGESAVTPDEHLAPEEMQAALNLSPIQPIATPELEQQNVADNSPARRVDEPRQHLPVLNASSPLVERPQVALPVATAQSMELLRTEIISFANNPTRPTVTLEIAPPEYGRVTVAAESDVAGRVTVRLVVDNQVVKEAIGQQVQPLFAGTSQNSPTTVAVFTTEEYQQYREQQRERNQDGNRKGRERRHPQNPQQVEFVI